MNTSTQHLTTARAPMELCALTDSLTSTIRWRMRDYEAMLRAELAMLAAPVIAAQSRSRLSARRSGRESPSRGH